MGRSRSIAIANVWSETRADGAFVCGFVGFRYPLTYLWNGLFCFGGAPFVSAAAAAAFAADARVTRFGSDADFDFFDALELELELELDPDFPDPLSDFESEPLSEELEESAFFASTAAVSSLVQN